LKVSESRHDKEVIFLVGFRTDAGIVGFEWRAEHSEAEALRGGWIEEGDADISAVREIVRPARDGREVTKFLAEQPEGWRPDEGEGRSDIAKLMHALDRAGYREVAADMHEAIDLEVIAERLKERGERDTWIALCVRRVGEGIGSPVPEALSCPRCGGLLEASGKIYFDVTATARPAGGPISVTGLEFAGVNDTYDGHPAALEHEINVSCSECGFEPDFVVDGAAQERTDFGGLAPQESEQLLAEARAIYQRSRDGQAAVEEWAHSDRVAPHINRRHCGPCEARTPHLGVICAACESITREGPDDLNAGGFVTRLSR
jgi:hypothetical protein